MPTNQLHPPPKPIGRDELVQLLELSLRIREGIIQVVFDSGSGHIGGALSQTDVICALYARYLCVDPARPAWPERDRFVLSKGHGGLGFVVLLAERGFIAREELSTFGRTGSALGMHLDRRRVPGVEASTGSLGHGLGVAVGMARGAELQGLPSRVVCLLSDGECYEGSTWEAAIAASAMKLGRLVAIIDRNRMTMDGPTETEVPLEPLADKWKAFGFRVLSCDGHSFPSITQTLDVAFDGQTDKPTIVIAETIKGKGVDFMENRSEWHYGSIDSEHHLRALASVRAAHEQSIQAIRSAR